MRGMGTRDAGGAAGAATSSASSGRTMATTRTARLSLVMPRGCQSASDHDSVFGEKLGELRDLAGHAQRRGRDVSCVRTALEPWRVARFNAPGRRVRSRAQRHSARGADAPTTIARDAHMNGLGEALELEAQRHRPRDVRGVRVGEEEHAPGRLLGGQREAANGALVERRLASFFVRGAARGRRRDDHQGEPARGQDLHTHPGERRARRTNDEQPREIDPRGERLGRIELRPRGRLEPRAMSPRIALHSAARGEREGCAAAMRVRRGELDHAPREAAVRERELKLWPVEEEHLLARSERCGPLVHTQRAQRRERVQQGRRSLRLACQHTEHTISPLPGCKFDPKVC